MRDGNVVDSTAKRWLLLLAAFLVPVIVLRLGLFLVGSFGQSPVSLNAAVFVELFLVGPVFGLCAGLLLDPRSIWAAAAGTALAYALSIHYVTLGPTLILWGWNVAGFMVAGWSVWWLRRAIAVLIAGRLAA